jgi:hypothetical protein
MRPLCRGIGSLQSKGVTASPPRRGDSAHGSAFDAPERLRFTSLRPPPAAATPYSLLREESRNRQIPRHVCAHRTEGARRRWQVRRSGSPRRNRPVRQYRSWNKPAWRTEQGERRAGKYRLARNTLCRGAEGESEHGAAGGAAPSVRRARRREPRKWRFSGYREPGRGG